ncbi:hypothetical protein F5144DRAFT_605599 [Chaetomium tenue]|uniref:Uncharacterized protein n=1 Tax=Chaetomium tenue TaxID=1854479 RepID=A0ACB7NXN7_9PEZI|nr:hypothetical protein F5144DRAFT_605599 [Chaetomium globosum]
MSLLYEMKFIPSVTTIEDKCIYFHAISHVPVDTNLDPAEDVAIPPQEQTSLTTPPPPPATPPPPPPPTIPPPATPPPPNRPSSPQVTWPPPTPPPAPRSLVGLEPSPYVSPAAAEALMSWKTIRFFSAVFRLMAKALAGNGDPVTYAHTELMKDLTRPDMAACALTMPLDMVRGAVDYFVGRRREVMKRRALAEEMGGMYEQRRGSEPGMLETEKIAKQWDAVVFYQRLDKFIDLEAVRVAMRRELEKEGWPDSRYRLFMMKLAWPAFSLALYERWRARRERKRREAREGAVLNRREIEREERKWEREREREREQERERAERWEREREAALEGASRRAAGG